MEHKLSTLEFAFRQRPYVKMTDGFYKSEPNFLDFIVDGQSLAEKARYDLFSVLCGEWAPEERERSVRRLLKEEPANFSDDRRSLLVCAECGGIDCGAVSVVVQLSDTTALWRDFGYQNDYEPDIRGEHLRNLGPFEFDLSEYRTKLIQALEMIKAPL
jgi:hypothetical protein